MRKRLKMLPKSGFYGVLFLAMTSVIACGDGSKTTFEFMPDMMDQVSVKAQEASMRTPPPGTIPGGFDPYPYTADQGDLAGLELKNPLERTKETILRGQTVYNNTCIVCHGSKGDGNGSIVPKFPRPPAVTSAKVTDWSDGRIYHVITRGQNLMGPYATQIPPEDRWAVAHYVRALGRAAHPTQADIDALKKALNEGTYP